MEVEAHGEMRTGGNSDPGSPVQGKDTGCGKYADARCCFSLRWAAVTTAAVTWPSEHKNKKRVRRTWTSTQLDPLVAM